jgi:hypothetical protein
LRDKTVLIFNFFIKVLIFIIGDVNFNFLFSLSFILPLTGQINHTLGLPSPSRYHDCHLGPARCSPTPPLGRAAAALHLSLALLLRSRCARQCAVFFC